MFSIRGYIILGLVGFLGFSGSASAKELANRLGVGYADQFTTKSGSSGNGSLPSIALRYYPDSKLGVGAQLGVDTEEDQSQFGFMVKLYRIIYPEDNMNFYMGTGAGLISEEVSGKSDSGFELSGFCGGEFFLTGLESLGFSFEVGVGVTSIRSEVRFRTIGDSPLRAGMTFYF